MLSYGYMTQDPKAHASPPKTSSGMTGVGWATILCPTQSHTPSMEAAWEKQPRTWCDVDLHFSPICPLLVDGNQKNRWKLRSLMSGKGIRWRMALAWSNGQSHVSCLRIVFRRRYEFSGLRPLIMVNQKNVFRVLGYINDRVEIHLLDPGASIKFLPVSRLTGIWGTSRWQAPVSTHGQQMCLWIFDLWFQPIKLVSKGSWKYTMYTTNIHSALILWEFLWYNSCEEVGAVGVSEPVGKPPCPRLLAVFYKTHAWIPLVTFVPAGPLYANISITAVFVPSYYNNNAKKPHTFKCKHKIQFQQGRKRGIAVLYLFEHSLISTHLSKLK